MSVSFLPHSLPSVLLLRVVVVLSGVGGHCGLEVGSCLPQGLDVRVGSQARPPAHARAANVALRNSSGLLIGHIHCPAPQASLQKWAKVTLGDRQPVRSPALLGPAPHFLKSL